MVSRDVISLMTSSTLLNRKWPPIVMVVDNDDVVDDNDDVLNDDDIMGG
jgi:hypothetical protein